MAFFAVVFIGVAPADDWLDPQRSEQQFSVASTWLGGMSPLSAPFYAAQTLIPAAIPIDAAAAVPRAFWFWQIIGALVVVCLIIQLRHVRKARALLAMQPPEMPPALPLNG